MGDILTGNAGVDTTQNELFDPEAALERIALLEAQVFGLETRLSLAISEIKDSLPHQLEAALRRGELRL